MRIDIVTLFPHIFDSYFNESILKRARQSSLVEVCIHNIRDYTVDRHHTTDDRPYGGGAGMVMMAEPILKTVAMIVHKDGKRKLRRKVVVLSAKGKPFSQTLAYRYAKNYDELIFISGRYEGIDERVTKILKAEEVSIGPYITTDGDVAAMVLVSAVARLVPGVIREESLAEESHGDALVKEETEENCQLEYPHYTRPEVLIWKGKKYRVPKVLLSGDHSNIDKWRKNKRKKGA
ncbi:MAG: tRNA (guanosine(37)-N1)-methyltransferase TrmD [Patescibacteria group bacterium]|jgi:tRNA (guanine37-N1)-methyltransferase